MAEQRRLMKTPKSLDLDITSRCNLRCKYCFHRTSPADTGGEVPTDTWVRFMDELGTCAVMDVTFGGGEPFIRDDLPALIDGVVRNRMRFSILSNGGLITPEIARYIASTGRCNYVQISIDGSCPEVHDRLRGPGSFDGAVRGIKILQAAGVPVTSRVTIHRYNLDDLGNIARFLLDEIGMGGISTNSACYLGLARANEEEVSLNAAEQCRAMEIILDLAKRYNNRITAAAGPLSMGRNFQEMEQARLDGRSLPGRGFLTGCGCMWSKMAVRPDGMMVPCGMLAHIELGRIHEVPLIDVWQNHPEFTRLRQRYTIPLSRFSECRECEYRMMCTGNCPASGYTRAGDVYAPSPDGCLKKFLEEGGRIVAIP
jgi:SynChlorMet cassette radical SAM/SPASM protein ScmE